jgi:hypothetical protein
VTPSSARRLFRRFTLGSGPLKRGSDRIQVGARALLLALLLAAVAVSLAVATAAATQTRDLADDQAASRHPVTATLLHDAVPPDGAGSVASVVATWSAPSGGGREGVVHVRTAAEAGTTVTVWVDEDGAITARPLGDADVVARAVGYGVPTLIGCSVLATLGYLGVCALLDRGRMRRWATDWAVVEPVWSRKVP